MLEYHPDQRYRQISLGPARPCVSSVHCCREGNCDPVPVLTCWISIGVCGGIDSPFALACPVTCGQQRKQCCQVRVMIKMHLPVSSPMRRSGPVSSANTLPRGSTCCDACPASLKRWNCKAACCSTGPALPSSNSSNVTSSSESGQPGMVGAQR